MPSTLRIKPALILDLGDGIDLAFQLIPAGSFRMGSRGMRDWEEPLHQVTITQPFYLGTFPVTQEEYAKWKPEHVNGFPNQPRNPAENMDWHEANKYCQWLKETCSDQLPVGYEVGLPTEAQWEYACRAGTDTEYYTGDGEAALAEAGWYAGNSRSQTHPVDSLKGNDFGLFHMHGNVWEWCADAWDADTYKKRLGKTCDSFIDGAIDAYRVVRGGSWNFSPWYCRATCRDRRWPGDRYWNRGFRVCLFLGPCPGRFVERSRRAQAWQRGTRQPSRSEIAQRAKFWRTLMKLDFQLRSADTVNLCALCASVFQKSVFLKNTEAQRAQSRLNGRPIIKNINYVCNATP